MRTHLGGDLEDPEWGSFLVDSPRQAPEGLQRLSMRGATAIIGMTRSESVSPSKASTCTCV